VGGEDCVIFEIASSKVVALQEKTFDAGILEGRTGDPKEAKVKKRRRITRKPDGGSLKEKSEQGCCGGGRVEEKGV